MCGIVGAVSGTGIEPARILRMRDQLAHRGPDSAGLWASDDSRVCLGHRRLAIIDLTPEANQPFVAGDGRYVVTFNGEIYNFRALRDELVSRGSRFRTQSDTEVLLEAYRCWGEGCLGRLSGMFAFAIWDAVQERLFCARDRVGEKPFYYAMVRDTFIFASELKALVLWPGFGRDIHYPALVDYLSLGFVADPKSIWEGCYKLPPGHCMWVETGSGGWPRVRDPVAYWDMEFVPDYGVRDWRPRILEVLQSASQDMAYADVPIGTFLSGGVDSSSVTAALCNAGRRVHSFTVGFEERDYDERRWAREVSRLYGTSHTECVVVPADVTAEFERLVWHYDEPFSDSSHLPTFYVCREARKAITVALSGDGGDEIFGGYTKYRRLAVRQQVSRFLPESLGAVVIAGAARVLPGFRERLLPYGMDVPAMMLDMLTLGLSLPELRGVARGPLGEALKHYAPMDTVLSLLRKAPPREVGLVNSMRYLDLKLTLAGDILVKVDRASMAVSLEVRPVYLHRDLIALAASIPPQDLADRRRSKKVLRSALGGWLPETLLTRKKVGFALPLKPWINGDLRDFFQERRGEQFLADVLDIPRLERVMSSGAGGRFDPTAVAHSLFFLKRWCAKWLDGDQAPAQGPRRGDEV